MPQGRIIPPGAGHGAPRVSVRVARIPWWIMLLIGFICIAAAVGLVAFPWAPVNMLSIIIGVGFIASGLSTLAMQRAFAGVVGGVVLVLVGVSAIIFREALSDIMVMVFGAGLIVSGALWLVLALRFGGRAMLLIPALLTLASGVFTLIWPTVVLTIVAVCVGLMLLIAGVFILRKAFTLRKAAPSNLVV